MLTERPFLVRWGPALLLAAWALLLSSWAHFIIAPQRNLLNDEAVELLQTVDLPFNTFHYLAPAHQDRWCEPVESAGIYLNRLFVGPGRYDVTPLRILHLVVFVGGVLVFYAAASRVLPRFFSVAASAIFAASSVNLYYNQVLTRNYLSAPLAALILFFLVRSFHARTASQRSRSLVWGVGCVLLVGVMTYSAFRPLAAALFVALMLEVATRPGSSVREKLQQCRMPVACFLGIGAATGALLWVSQTPLGLFVSRGTYSLAKGLSPWSSLGLTWASPIWLTRSSEYEGKFIIDETHWAFEQPYILWPLAAFYVLGLLGGLLGRGREGRPEFFIAAWTVVLCQAVLSAGGPNLKYSYVLFPFYVLLTFAGLQVAAEAAVRGLQRVARLGPSSPNPRFPPSVPGFVRAGVIAGLVLYVGLDVRHLAGRPAFINDLTRDPDPLRLMVHYQKMHRLALDTAQTAIDLARASPESMVYAQAVWGGDLVYWMIRPYGNIKKVDTPQEFSRLVEAQPGRKAVLVFNHAGERDVIRGFHESAQRHGVEVHFLDPIPY
ncbi:MAG: hypothetical protein ACK5CF_05275 [Opitutaceae bacterium]